MWYVLFQFAHHSSKLVICQNGRIAIAGKFNKNQWGKFNNKEANDIVACLTKQHHDLQITLQMVNT